MTKSLRTLVSSRQKPLGLNSSKGTGSPQRDPGWELHTYIWSAELSRPEGSSGQRLSPGRSTSYVLPGVEPLSNRAGQCPRFTNYTTDSSLQLKGAVTHSG